MFTASHDLGHTWIPKSMALSQGEGVMSICEHIYSPCWLGNEAKRSTLGC